jgi:cyclohexa-1,5-dienecarbonyl-CoA hydratase
MTEPLKVWLDREGRLLRLRLARPKANIVDAAMVGALAAALDKHRGDDGVSGALLDAEGPNFSFGASVEEHLPQNCAAMLAALHGLIVKMLEWPAPILVAVRGQCLGGGLEVALAASRIFAAHDARLGQPEMKLAVFAPAASCLLPFRVNQQTAEDMLFSGRVLNAAEARVAGLVAEIADDPAAAALNYFDAQLSDKSAAALGYALRAARGAMLPEVKRRLGEVEKLYLEELMKTHDANEGLAAFLEKRAPKWQNR